MRSMLVRDHMSKNLITRDPAMEILHAVYHLILHNIFGAPVLDRRWASSRSVTACGWRWKAITTERSPAWWRSS
jgi:hypothetical protein